MFNLKHVVIVLALVLAALSAACIAGPNAYKVSATLMHDGKPFASPAVIVTPGVPAKISVSGQDKASYDLSLTITEVGDNKVKVASKLDSAQYGRITPVVIVRLGKSAMVQQGQDGSSLGIKLTVTRAGS